MTPQTKFHDAAMVFSHEINSATTSAAKYDAVNKFTEDANIDAPEMSLVLGDAQNIKTAEVWVNVDDIGWCVEAHTDDLIIHIEWHDDGYCVNGINRADLDID